MLSAQMCGLQKMWLLAVLALAAAEPCFRVKVKSSNGRGQLRVAKRVVKDFWKKGPDSRCGKLIHMDSMKVNGVCIKNVGIHADNVALRESCIKKYKHLSRPLQDHEVYRRCAWITSDVYRKHSFFTKALRSPGKNTIVAFDRANCKNQLGAPFKNV
mmetsp:Transcript_20566/g.64695  ORF Transcript_20566/g.64695 Transcript_20566/m.64695 type:complete len:157 (+) Transcript_20566:42-512(+)